MISTRIEKALNVQINAELESAYIYLSMAGYFESKNLPGFAHWMKEQSKEEYRHAMRIFGYINERGGKVELDTIKKPENNWVSPMAVFEAAYAHEKKITSAINSLMDLSVSEKDYATQIFLQWFVSEQIEEENSAFSILSTLKDLGDCRCGGLYVLDKQMGKRSS